jgi:hypothetical protein
MAEFRPGDMVELRRDPLLYGRMLVVEVVPDVEVVYTRASKQHAVRRTRGIKWIVCLVNPDAWHKRAERFYPSVPDDELILSPELEEAA